MAVSWVGVFVCRLSENAELVSVPKFVEYWRYPFVVNCILKELTAKLTVFVVAAKRVVGNGTVYEDELVLGLSWTTYVAKYLLLGVIDGVEAPHEPPTGVTPLGQVEHSVADTQVVHSEGQGAAIVVLVS